jgi:hypothetical protein
MNDTGGAPFVWADRVRVSRRLWGRMNDTGGAPFVWADRVRVSRMTLEAA